MKNKFLILLLLTSFIFVSIDIMDYRNTLIIDDKKLDGNFISAWFKNNGSFNRDPVTGNSGFEWPIGTGKNLTYTSGLWISGITGKDTLAAISDYHGNEFLPGYIDNNGIPQGNTNSEFRIYKIIKGDTSGIDYINWPIDQGAYPDSNSKPFLPGTQTLFYCMTDGYTDVHTFSAPLKAQVQVTSWSYNTVTDPVISNTIFSEFKIINKNLTAWNDAVISVWSDECSGDYIAVGCDTALNLGYSYCQPESFQYGNNPPAHGFLLLQGPSIYTGNINDTVHSFIPGKSNRRTRIGYKETGLRSFNMFQNASLYYKEPANIQEIYSTVRGLFFNGNPWINPNTNSISKFPFSGDPESGTGWYQSSVMGYGNRRLLMNFGNLNFNPGDTQSIIVAQIVSQGTNNLNSVTKLKQNSVYIKNVFSNNFTTVSVKDQNETIIPESIILFQNFPNPFNPITTINFELRHSEFVLLKIYDINGRELKTLTTKSFSVGNHSVIFDGRDFASGVYFYKISAGNFSVTKKMLLNK